MLAPADLLPRLRITRSRVLLDGERVGTLRYSGKMTTVLLAGKSVGRLMPAGYTRGVPDDGSGLLELWTAKHPDVPTPSDTIIGSGLTLRDAVALLVGRADSNSLPC